MSTGEILYMEYDSLINDINRLYQVSINRIELYRDMIGRVYFLHSKDKRYVFKVYRSFKTEDAIQTVCILDYLKANSYPAVSVVRTAQNESNIFLDFLDSRCAGILFEYVDGTTPEVKLDAESIGKQIGELHRLMENYPGKLINKTKIDYIDDYISIMKEKNFDFEKILDLEQYGNDLWERINKLPKSFCHGDLHTGNMIKNQTGEYVIFDFDDASGDYPSMDVAYMSDDTNFNKFQESMYSKSIRLFERFYSGYSKTRILSDRECNSIFDFIAVRHFQIISRIVRCQGLQNLDENDWREQYDWLMKWRELCIKKQHWRVSMDNEFAIYIERAIKWAKERLDSSEYTFKCLAFVEDAYEKGNNLEIFGGSSAKESADEYEAGNNTGVPPIGAFVFYDCFGTLFSEYKNYGHVGLHIGDGNVIHAWDRVRIDNYMEIENFTSAPGWTKPKFIGWSPVERIFIGYRKK